MLPVYHDFSKRDKKIISSLISKCVNAEIADFAQRTQADYQNLANSNEEDLRPAYWDFAEKIKEFSKHLTRRYDNTRHRDYPQLIMRLLVDKLLAEAVLAELSDAGREKMLRGVEVLRAF